MSGRSAGLAARLILSSTLLAVPLASGQETYRLDDTDTWQRAEAPEPGTAAAQLASARRALAAGNNRRAEFLANEFIERHADDPLLPHAYLVRGDALLGRGEEYEALFEYELVARAYPGSEVFVTALEREMEIARRYARGLRRKLWGFRVLGASDEAEELLIRIQERLPGSRLAEEAGMELADFYFRNRQMELAAEMYALFIENFPRSERVAKAQRRLIYAHLAEFKGPEFDAAGLFEARTRIQSLKATDPAAAQRMGADALLTRIDESDARKLLVTARWYLATNDPIAAELTIRRLVERYPRTVAARDAMRAIPAILRRLPAPVLAEAPDYETLRAAILGPAAESAPEPEPEP